MGWGAARSLNRSFSMPRSQPINHQTKILRKSSRTERKLVIAQGPHAGSNITLDQRDYPVTRSGSDFPKFLRCYYSLVERLDPLLMEDDASLRPPECWKPRPMFPNRSIELVLGARRMRMVSYRSEPSWPCKREGWLDEKRRLDWSQRWHCRGRGRCRCRCRCRWQSCSYSSLGPSCSGFF